MREILFRGWAVDDGRLIDNSPTLIRDADGVWLVPEGGTEPVRVDENSVFQFTGLLDKNGKRIFEGDIVDAAAHEYKFVVIFDRCRFIAQTFKDNVFESNVRHTILLGLCVPRAITVIGNVHDNPELMEVGE